MLKVDDRFKSWMRNQLKDREYAESVMNVVVELEDATLTDIWPHAALPVGSETDNDPEAMIGMLKGHDNQKGRDFIVAIFGKWDDFIDLCFPYAWMIWSTQHPAWKHEFVALPDLYEIAFQDMDTDHVINHARWCNKEGDELKEFGVDRFKINLINTKLDSDVIRVITRANKGNNQI